jgi:quercetin dioxygenase-like cupin family protein
MVIDAIYPFVRTEFAGESDFEVDPAYSFLRRRRTDIVRGTNGLADVRICRCDDTFVPQTPIAKHSDVSLVIRYLVSGELQIDVDDYGSHTLRPGSAWSQSIGITDRIRCISAGSEYIEVSIPGNFANVDIRGQSKGTHTAFGDRRLPPPLCDLNGRFVVDHLRNDSFVPGRRINSFARDLGVSAMTDGAVVARIGRRYAPVPAVPERKHYHSTCLQLVYLVRGWLRTEFEGQGEVHFQPGSCWTQPPYIEHAMRAYSDASFELFEVIVPANFGTVEVDDPYADAVNS